jgi:RNA polymerase sigma factor (sigma-70 family)
MDEQREQAMAKLERWVTAYQPVVFRAAYLILRDTQAAEDVAQDTFIKAYNAALRYDPGEGVRSWLYRIAVNTSLNEVRRRKRERTAVDRLDRGDVPDPSGSVDTSSDLAEAIDRLPERLRIAVICRYFLDLSEAEMAGALKVRPGTVKSRLHEARALLAKDPGLVVSA